jgi:hypothetical protein
MWKVAVTWCHLHVLTLTFRLRYREMLQSTARPQIKGRNRKLQHGYPPTGCFAGAVGSRYRHNSPMYCILCTRSHARHYVRCLSLALVAKIDFLERRSLTTTASTDKIRFLLRNSSFLWFFLRDLVNNRHMSGLKIFLLCTRPEYIESSAKKDLL